MSAMKRKGAMSMKARSFLYSLKQGMKNIVRNKFYSLASLATMIVCIFLFGLFCVVVVNVNHIVKEAEKGMAVVVYFNEDTTDEQISRIGDQIRACEGVESVEYVSAEQAWEEFAPVYFGGDASMAEGFEDDNPLADSDNYQVHLNDVSKQDQVMEYIAGLEGVRKVNGNEDVADTLSNVNVLIGYLSAAIIVLLFLVAVFLISNTVAVSITVRKEEIGIMKMIGATDLFVRAPFAIEGMVLGLIGSGLPLILLAVLYSRVEHFIQNRFGMLSGMLTFISAGKIFTYLVPVSLLIGIGIGFIGSMLTIRKHLRV